MKNAVFAIILIAFLSHAHAQHRYNIAFAKEQTTMGWHQKRTINNITTRLNNGVSVTFYPVVFDSLTDAYQYTPDAGKQAESIVEYASTMGFTLIGMPRNFPSAYKGLSVSVVMKYTKPDSALPEMIATTPGEGVRGHFPEKPSQYFVIDPLKDTVIYGNEGTKLVFAAGCLLSKKEVQVELKEFYKLEDYIKGGLQTVSNGRLIQTGGSLYLDVRETGAGKRQVPINPEKGVGVDFTLGKNDDEMQIFIKDPHLPNEVNWILPKKRIVKESWQLTETVIGPDGKVISRKKYNSKEEWDAHVKEEEKKAKEAEEREKEKEKQEAIRQETSNKMDSKLQIYDLGYINCDKFYNEPTIPLTFEGDKKVNAEYYLVYTDERGVMKGESNGQNVSFGSVAKNRKAVLIAVCFIAKQAYYFKCLVSPGGKLESKVSLQPVEESFLNKQLALLK